AKYDSNGVFQWVQQAGGTGTDRGNKVAVGGSGHSYVTGRFNGTATFVSTSLISPGGNEMFVAKYDSSGTLLWAKRAGGTLDDVGTGIEVDQSGNSYLTGFSTGTAIFGPGDPNQTVLTSAGTNDIFVAKYDTNGALRWVKGAGGTLLDQGLGLAVDGLGNSVVTGFFNGTVTFGAGEVTETMLTSAGGTDIFVAKLRDAEDLQFGGVNVTGGQNVIAGGAETSGSSRGAAFQAFNTAGVLQTTQFTLNPDFRDIDFVFGNFDADAADEVLVGGWEIVGAARGPAYQLFDTDGSLLRTGFVLNTDFAGVSFSPFNVSSGNGVLACGQETQGAARGPAYQAFDQAGTLVRTQFALNTDFKLDNDCLGFDLDAVAGDEVIMVGREVTGAARGPAIQAFNSDGTLRFTQFVLNTDFIETKFTVADISSNGIIAYGRETLNLGRGPAFQTFDSNGTLLLTRFVLNDDFTNFQVFGANTTNGVLGDEIVSAGSESGGAARGPAMQVWDNSGNLLFTRFVLNPDFAQVKFGKIDVNNDGVDEILVMGREISGASRGPAIQLFDGTGNLLMTAFVLNTDFTDLKFFAVDQDGNGDNEIGVAGRETTGAARGPAYQIFESDGTLLQTSFVLNADF
ncbi:MAG: SBBP repeat-containing protein, partial [Deltaproteobacteria bacterium]|nr:SBBP repeat-containing protein [Deltaproteobacteria bacterium]